MQAAGVALHAITAEPGGDEVILARLAKRDCGGLPFAVHSDPNYKLLATPQSELYVFTPMNTGLMLGGDYTGISYSRVEPAMTIVNKDGVVIQKWSWRSLPNLPKLYGNFLDGGKQQVKVRDEWMMLVAVRPDSADILPSIRAGRDVRLKASQTKSGTIYDSAVEVFRGWGIRIALASILLVIAVPRIKQRSSL